MIELNIGRRLVLGAVAALALTAAIPGAQAQEKMKLKLILPTTVTTFMLPYIVPKDQGWYDKAGLDVEEVFVAGDSTALRTTLAGSGDITIVGPPTVFHAVLEGAKVPARLEISSSSVGESRSPKVCRAKASRA